MLLARLLTAVFMGLFGLHLLSRAIEVRRTIRSLRRLDPERRRAIIKNIRPFVARTYYDQQLSIDGEPEISPAVERYLFSPRERREQELLYWAVTLFAALALLAQMVIARASLWERLVSGVVVAACVAALWFLRKRNRRLDTTLEVTPFGITEIHPDGQRRHLSFAISLELRVNRRRSRAELAAFGAREDFIALDFDRVGFNRLLERVIDYGGFRPSSPKAAAPLPRSDPDRAVIVPAPPPWSIQSLSSYARAAVRSWPAAIAVGVALWVLRPPPRVTHFGSLTVPSTALSPARMTYLSTHHGSYWVDDPDSLVLAVRSCGAAWCLTDASDSLRLASADLRPLSARVHGIAIVWRNDSVHGTYTDIEKTTRFDTPARPGALPNMSVLDLLIARSALRAEAGEVVPLQAIEAKPDDPVDRIFTGDRIKGERGEILRLVHSDTAVVEVAGRIVTPYQGVRLIVHYPDRVVRLWVMDSTHYIVRREAQFRDHLVGTWVDSLIGVE